MRTWTRTRTADTDANACNVAGVSCNVARVHVCVLSIELQKCARTKDYTFENVYMLYLILSHIHAQTIKLQNYSRGKLRNA